jgi:hypothetical protein
MRRILLALLLLPLSGAIPFPARAQGPVEVGPILPFRVEYRLRQFSEKPPLPGLQAYAATMVDGKILVLGGRTQGLHFFNPPPAQNMPPRLANNLIVVIDPETGEWWSHDVSLLSRRLGDAIRANNQQSWYDRGQDQWYILGGYGWDRAANDMRTFPTLLRVSARRLIAEVTRPGPHPNEAIEAQFELHEDERFAVTGGGLHRLGGNFYLVMGQRFDGEYRVFDPGTPTREVNFRQRYTEEIRVFTLKPGSLEILSYGALSSDDPGQPLHRRDGPIVGTIDPRSGEPRIAAFGGVFIPGTTQGYTAPVYISDRRNQPDFLIDTRVQQHFSQYECPVLPIHDSEAKTIYHLFFGGLSHSIYGYDKTQNDVYQLVTSQERADGVPFIGAVSGLIQRADGTYDQFLLPDLLPPIPIPEAVQKSYFDGFPQFRVNTTNLYGSSVELIPDSRAIESGKINSCGVLDLSRLKLDERIVVGHVYGSIASVFPYALRPSQGTFPSNALLEITVTRSLSQSRSSTEGIPASVTTKRAGR